LTRSPLDSYPKKPLWITEWGLPNQDLNTTRAYFNQSLPYLDGSAAVERYSYFGAFRSVVSNVGPNGTMLDMYGNLTDIGSWYLGGNATGHDPFPSDTGPAACSAAKPCGSGSGAVKMLGGMAGLSGRYLVAVCMLATLLAHW